MTPIEKRAQELYPYIPVEQGDYGNEQKYLKNKSKIDKYRKVHIDAATEWKAEADRLREALCELMKGIDGLPPLSAISGVLTNQYNQAKEAITKYDNKVK